MRINIKLDTDNAAFESEPMDELRRIFLSVALGARMEMENPTLRRVHLRDSNGNTVGHADFTIED